MSRWTCYGYRLGAGATWASGGPDKGRAIICPVKKAVGQAVAHYGRCLQNGDTVASSSDKIEFTHLGADGEARMVDVSSKAVTDREASASAAIEIRAEVLDAIVAGSLSKGDAIATARIAGIQAAKRTSELIPLCHPLPLDRVTVEFKRVGPETLVVTCTARATARTGVEMECLTGASVAALTVYDMAKSADRAMRIGPVQLERKSGGKSGPYEREV